MADDSRNLLQEYVRSRSDEAVRALVGEHSSVVYATALRCLNGDRAAAQDVTQEVFLLLLRKASGLQGVLLSGWLYRQACRRAANYARSERRRRQRERIAADGMEADVVNESPFLSRELDDALLSLPQADRDAVVLRFFEGKDFRAVGSALEVTEEAARKRVKRALDRLGEILKKRGAGIGGGSLEVTLLGMECQPTPEPFLSVLTAKTVKSAAAFGSGSAAVTILKPFLAGSVAASLVAGTAMLVTQPSAKSAPENPDGVVRQASERRPRTEKAVADVSPLEGIVEEIRRVRTGPENSITKLQVEAILGRVTDEQIPAFIALAGKKLVVEDQAAVFQPLLKRWVKTDPAAALDFIAENNVGKNVDVATHTNLLEIVFSDWARKDRGAASAWLVKNWETPALADKAFMTNLRIFLAMEIADSLFRNQGVDPLFNFVGTLPEAARFEVLGVAAGDCQWLSATPQIVPEMRLLEFHRKLQEMSDKEEVAKLATRFWTNVASQTHAIDALQSEFTPMEKFQVALGEMNVMSKRKSKAKPKVGEGPVSFDLVKDHAEREQAAMKAGEAAGLPREEILKAVGRAIFASRHQKRIDEWYAANGGDPGFDHAFAEMAKEAARANGWSGDRLPEMTAIGWASKISDTERRLSLSRASFLRLIARDPEKAKAFLEREKLPADVSAELKSLIADHP